MSHASANGQRPLPPGWEWRPLGDFLVESRIPGSSGVDARKLTVKLYGKGVEAKSERRIGSENTRYYVRRAGQFIYSKLDFLNGAFGIVPENLDGYESTLDVPAFDIRPGVEPAWLLAFVSRKDFYEAQARKGRGGRKARRIAPEDLLQIPIPIPPKAKLRPIAGAIEAARTVADSCDAELEQLLRVKRAVLAAQLAHCPKAPIGDVASIGHGMTPSKARRDYWADGHVAWVASGGVNQRRIKTPTALISEKALRECSLQVLPPGTCVVAMIGQGKTRGTAAILEIEAAINQNLAFIKPTQGLEPEFLLLVLEHSYEELRGAGHNSGQSSLNCGTLRSFRIPLPEPLEQRRIVSVVGALDQVIKHATEAGKLAPAFLGKLVTNLTSVRNPQP